MAAHAKRATKQETSDDPHKKKKIVGAVVGLIAAGGIIWYQVTRESAAMTASSARMVQCASTGKVFEKSYSVGESQPYECDICDKTDAYDPEKCYWTKNADGKWAIKETPTYVILPYRLNPAGARSMTCPDCGREIVGHNPKPSQGEIDWANSAEESGKTDADSSGGTP